MQDLYNQIGSINQLDYLRLMQIENLIIQEIGISILSKQMVAMRKAQKRIQVIWIINFLMIAVPISVFLAGRFIGYLGR